MEDEARGAVIILLSVGLVGWWRISPRHRFVSDFTHRHSHTQLEAR